MEGIFSTRERIRILESIIFKENKNNISVNNIANQLKLSKGLVSKYFEILSKEGILKKTERKAFITDSSLVKGVRILFNMKKVSPKIFKKYPFVKSASIYGGCAKGENIEDSDVDLWIRVKDTDEDRLASLTSELNKKIKNVKVLFLTNGKIEKLRKEDPLFYHSLVFGSLIVYGEKNGIQS